jgi:hypothetical protein
MMKLKQSPSGRRICFVQLLARFRMEKSNAFLGNPENV